MADEHGQASIEWIGLLLLVTVALAAALAFLPAVDGRPLGASIARALVCAVKHDCHSEGLALKRAYGERDAGLVRHNAPNVVYERGTYTLPIDYRHCRSHRCADAPDQPGLDVHRSRRGSHQATAFTHVVRRGGRTYIQYWFYYPDSPSTAVDSHGIWKDVIQPLTGIHDPFDHPDDWEGYQVRIDPDGSRWARSTRHGGYTSCKGSPEPIPNWCAHWGHPNGWTRVSRGSHAGHIPDMTFGNGFLERTTAAPGIRLVPLETLDHRSYRPQKGGIKPPWTKQVYVNPAADSS